MCKKTFWAKIFKIITMVLGHKMQRQVFINMSLPLGENFDP
jgi:hypothetical protein